MIESTLFQKVNIWEIDNKYEMLFPNEAALDLARKLNIKNDSILVVSVGMLDIIGYKEFPANAPDKEILKEVLLSNAINYFIVDSGKRDFSKLKACKGIPLVDVLHI